MIVTSATCRGLRSALCIPPVYIQYYTVGVLLLHLSMLLFCGLLKSVRMEKVISVAQVEVLH